MKHASTPDRLCEMWAGAPHVASLHRAMGFREEDVDEGEPIWRLLGRLHRPDPELLEETLGEEFYAVYRHLVRGYRPLDPPPDVVPEADARTHG